MRLLGPKMADSRRRLFERLRTKVKIPFIRCSLSWGLLLALAFVFVIASVFGISYTNRSVFCSSCHEMDIHYASPNYS